LLKDVRDKTQLDIKRADFKLELVQPHLFMNYRVVDEHGRQLGQGRNLASLKAELGAQARGAFQALAALKGAVRAEPASEPVAAPQSAAAGATRVAAVKSNQPASSAPAKASAAAAYTDWTFGELPELMEIQKGSQTLIGFPALIDKGAHVEIEVFDEPGAAEARHRAGLRRLIALQIKEPLKYLEKNIPDLQKMAMAYMTLGTADELRDQIIEVALDRAFLQDPLPTNADHFKARIEEGRTRLNLIAQEIARLAGQVLIEYQTAVRKLKDSKPGKDVADDVTAQLQRLMPKRFVALTTYTQLQHAPRYLKGITLRLDKLRADPARDAAKLAELRPIEQRYTRRLAELKGTPDARLDEFRWLLEELRVSLFSQELRTPQPVSVKRLEKVWAQMST
jgi:ATP-dependent helicase HrpA